MPGAGKVSEVTEQPYVWRGREGLAHRPAGPRPVSVAPPRPAQTVRA